MNKRPVNSHLNKKLDAEAEYKMSYYDILINSRTSRLKKISGKLVPYSSLKEEKSMSAEIQRAIDRQKAMKLNDE